MNKFQNKIKENEKFHGSLINTWNILILTVVNSMILSNEKSKLR